MACACGCPGVPKAGKRFVHGHNLPAVNANLTPEERQQRGRTRAAQRTREEWAAWGRQGGRTTSMKRWATLLRMWVEMNPREALRAAYAAGYHAGYEATKKASAA